MTLGLIAIPSHRAALASFLCADWFFAKYAKNYYAKALLARTAAHREKAEEAGVNADSVCLHCWHFRREAALEDEFHVICVCPAYHRARAQLLSSLPPETTLNTSADMCQLFSSDDVQSLTALGRFLVSVRQTRRKSKLRLEHLSQRLQTRMFTVRKAVWHFKGRPSCRHGVLYTQLPPTGCKCMADSSLEADWQFAKFMPTLDEELKCITAAPFDKDTFKRLAVLQAEARRLGW